MNDKDEISALYTAMLAFWNERDAKGMASLFAEDGYAIGFDGSQYDGNSAFEAGLKDVFSSHETAAYVWKIKDVRLLSPTVGRLRAAVGMVPRGKQTVNPAANAFQTLETIKVRNEWRIALLQNTPAQFHERPDLAEALTQELQALLPGPSAG